MRGEHWLSPGQLPTAGGGQGRGDDGEEADGGRHSAHSWLLPQQREGRVG